jgi:hypothetical protein
MTVPTAIDGRKPSDDFRIELISPTTQSYKTRLLRRTIQSYVEFTLFPLEESRFYYAVNSTFLGCSVRVK